MKAKSSFRDQVTVLVDKFIDSLVLVMIDTMMEASRQGATTKPVAAKKISEEVMRCRYISPSRHHCTNRSKGPRFHYLCDEHRGKAVKGKK